MRFNGAQCVSCKKAFTENDDVVVCPECGSPHHRVCWFNKGDCENADLHKDGFLWVFPEELRPKEPKKKHQPEPVPSDYRFKNGENAVVCHHCGTLNYGNDALCLKCRNPLQDIPENEERRTVREEDMYELFRRYGGLRPDILIDGIPVAEYSDYIGEKKSGRYIRRFMNMERFDRKISVSIWAFLFGPIWFLYRKMFKEGLLFLLIMLVFSGIQTWCSVTEPVRLTYTEMGAIYGDVVDGSITIAEFEEKTNEITQKYMSMELSQADKTKNIIYEVVSIIQLVFNLFMAFFADYLYKKKIKADILKIRRECSDMPTYRRTLHERGGVSIGGAILGVLAVGIIYFISFLPAYIIMFSSMM
ncbi:MAG: DUF2628 domain-containing protein [Clostridia bacterium]|nr:DUF2628 domain-containing protein [Clostridia bacterium]